MIVMQRAPIKVLLFLLAGNVMGQDRLELAKVFSHFSKHVQDVEGEVSQ